MFTRVMSRIIQLEEILKLGVNTFNPCPISLYVVRLSLRTLAIIFFIYLNKIFRSLIMRKIDIKQNIRVIVIQNPVQIQNLKVLKVHDINFSA